MDDSKMDNIAFRKDCISHGHMAIVLRSIACVTCVLSVIGSFMIIATYAIFRDIRSRVRLILLHLSIMDMGVALANLIGTSVNHHPRNHTSVYTDTNGSFYYLCETQAFISMYATYGSVFWTNCLAVYLYFAVIHHSTKRRATILFWVSCGISYVLPLVLCIWLLLTSRLGFSKFASGGWCAIMNTKSGQTDFFLVTFGYDFFIYVTFIVVPILYIGTRVHIKLEIQRAKEFVHPSVWLSAVNSIDYKFLLIPIAFIFLRIWTCLFNILFDYTNLHRSITNTKHGCIIIDILLCLAAIGDSGQGAANGIIFIFFTKKVREKLFLRCKKRNDSSNHESDPLLNNKKVFQTKTIQNHSSDYVPPSPLPSITPPHTPSPIPSDNDIYY